MQHAAMKRILKMVLVRANGSDFFFESIVGVNLAVKFPSKDF